MEMLTYSLWFTLVWWITSTVLITYKMVERTDGSITWYGFVNDIIVLPAIAILLEYLIVR